MRKLTSKVQFKNRSWLYMIFICIVVASCSKKESIPTPPEPKAFQQLKVTNSANSLKMVTLLQENFEQGIKRSYAAGDVQLSSGSWNLSDALIGTLESDRKEGNKSVRVRNSGIVHMNFDLQLKGQVTITVKHAIFGEDDNGTWELWASTDQGGTYFKIGNSVSSNTTELQVASFSINSYGPIRFELRKTDNGSNRLNFDDFTVTGQSEPGGGGDTTVVPGDNDHLLLGNPSNASSSVMMFNNYLMDKIYYKLSYSRDRGEPNWVCWHLSAEDLGDVSRSNDFRADPTLPDGWYQVQNTSYTRSGFDRGHNCPSGDRTATEGANSATFLMTNMIPQAPNHNRRMWANLENYTRSLVRAGNEAYVIMGSYGAGGTGSNGNATTIDNGNVTVPSNIWKIILVLPNGNNDLKRISANTRVITVNTPNNNEVTTSWSTYLTSINDIERVTNYSLLTNVPENIRVVLKTKVDSGE